MAAEKKIHDKPHLVRLQVDGVREASLAEMEHDSNLVQIFGHLTVVAMIANTTSIDKGLGEKQEEGRQR